jgi:hypothetical protein
MTRIHLYVHNKYTYNVKERERERKRKRICVRINESKKSELLLFLKICDFNIK